MRNGIAKSPLPRVDGGMENIMRPKNIEALPDYA